MNVSATALGQLVSALIIIFGVIGYFLGKRKTNSPVIVAILASMSAFIPPLGLLFLMILSLKKDIKPADA